MILGKKGNQIDAGYVFAPYIMMTTSSVVIDNTNTPKLRKYKISKIFNLDYKSDLFTPSKSISATKIINSNMYGVTGSSGTGSPTGSLGISGSSGTLISNRMRKIKNIFK